MHCLCLKYVCSNRPHYFPFQTSEMKCCPSSLIFHGIVYFLAALALRFFFSPLTQSSVFSLSFSVFLVCFFSGFTGHENIPYKRMCLPLVLSHGGEKNHNEVSSWEVIAHVFLPMTLKGHLLRKIKLVSSREHGFAMWLCGFNSLWMCL